MATHLTYSTNYLKTFKKLAKPTSNYLLFTLEISTRSTIIVLGIRKTHQNRPCRRSMGGLHFFHWIHTLLTNARHQQHASNLNLLPSINKANLKTIQLVDNTTGKSRSLQCATINCRSIINKSANLKVEISNKNFDLCALTKTWIKEEDTIIPLALCPSGYKSISIPWQNRLGGGIAIIYRNTLSLSHNSTYNFQSMECSDFRLDLPSQCVNLAIIYRPPDRKFQQFLNEFCDYMESNINTTGKLLLTGDFNIKINDENNHETAKFLDFLESFIPVNHIHFGTHHQENTLDLVISSEQYHLVHNPIKGCLFSNHNFVYYNLLVNS